MNHAVRIAIAAATVVILAVVGVNLLPKTGGSAAIGGATSTTAPTATAVPTAAPTATRASIPGPTLAPTLPPDGQLAAGTYRSDFLTFTLPAGWNSGGGYLAAKPDGGAPNGMVVAPDQGFSTVYKDPCRWQTTGTSIGPTVDDLVMAFVAQKRGSVVTPRDVTIDGFHGKEIDLVVPLTVEIAACDGGKYASWGSGLDPWRWSQGPGQHDLLDILDVNGRTLLVRRSYWPANTAADLAELKAIFDSIKITP